MAEPMITSLSDRALTIEVASPAEARALGSVLRDQGLWQEVVPGIRSLSVLFDPLKISVTSARERIMDATKALPRGEPCVSGAPLIIPVHYGDFEGPDLGHVSHLLGLSERRFVELHTEGLYTVDMMGFLPGFAYLGGLDPRLAVARRAEPRLRVPAGAVAIGGDRAGIYSLEGSGGWQVIGRTPHPLFNAQADDPFVLKPGMTLRFEVAS